MLAIKQVTTVQPGGVIQIASDQLPVGVRVEVIVLVDELTPADTIKMQPSEP